MISQAFAVVKPIDEHQNQLRSQLREQLALEAVIEFFREHQRPQYDKKLTDFLYLQQNDAGALGKAAEWFLAWVSFCVVKRSEGKCRLTLIRKGATKVSLWPRSDGWVSRRHRTTP